MDALEHASAGHRSFVERDGNRAHRGWVGRRRDLLMVAHDLMGDRDSLAISFFLLAHDPFDHGRLTLNPEILGYGLVGGKFADLILKRWLRIDDDRVIAPDGGGTGRRDRQLRRRGGEKPESAALRTSLGRAPAG